MNIDKINTGLGLTANLGVIIGLIFVVLELRQNRQSMDASIQLALSESYQQIASRPIENPEFANAIAKAFTKSDELDMVQYIQMMSWTQEYLAILYATYLMRESGTVDDETWQHNAKYFAAFLDNESYFKLYWSTSREIYPEHFFEAIEAHRGQHIHGRPGEHDHPDEHGHTDESH